MNRALDLSEVKSFLDEATNIQGDLEVSALVGGGNNQAFELRVNRRPYFLKHYFGFEGDLRDRLCTEFAFLTFAWRNGIRVVPKPIACDVEKRLGLYEFIKGRALAAEELSLDFVQQALGFYHNINKLRDEPGARQLGPASEACFSLSDHLGCVEDRLRRLKQISIQSAADAEGVSFVSTTVDPTWQRIVSALQDETLRAGIDPGRHITDSECCLSPSDFGFHNAILSLGGSIRFIDFEYAGWDDPAKLVCDFFCQIGVPVADRYLPFIIESVAGAFPNPDRLRQRIKLLFPVYMIKWCCIILNALLPAGRAKATFRQSPLTDEQKTFQLNKTRQFIKEKIVMCHRYRDCLMVF